MGSCVSKPEPIKKPIVIIPTPRIPVTTPHSISSYTGCYQFQKPSIITDLTKAPFSVQHKLRFF
jgi:hypothetical protein